MGGKSSGAVATNDQLVAMQQQQAAQATEANVERNARLQYGTNEINQIFQGHPAGATQVDLSALKQPGFGAGADWITATKAGGAVAYGGYIWNGSSWVPDPNASSEPGMLPSGYGVRQMPDSGGATQYGLYGPDNNLITTGSSIADLANSQIWTGGDPSKGTEGGFQPSFYDKYTQSMLDYYLPQEGQQYTQARSNLAYSLARAGSLNSSVAGMDVAKLAQQDQINQAQIAAQADNATGQLRTQVQQDQEAALNQLYSTEDPSVAASTAENMVANAQLTKPLLNPIGALFTPISVGVGTAMTGYTNPYAYLANTTGLGGATGTTTPGGAGSQGGNISGGY